MRLPCKPTKLNERQWGQTRTPAFKAWFGEFELSEKSVEAAQSFIQDALDKKKMSNHKLWEVDAILAKEIKSKTGLNVSGYTLELVADDIRHAKKSHGDAEKESLNHPDQVAIDNADLLALPYIIKSPDNIRRGSGNSIVFEKKVNGTIESVELVSNKYGKLRNKTMWKKKAAVGTNANRNDSPSHTSEYTAAQPSMYRSIDDFLEKSKPSKVVDENGEPMVVYHGTRSQKPFTVFESDKGNPANDGVHFFSSDQGFASKFGELSLYFLNLKNPSFGGFDGSGVQGAKNIYRDGGIYTKRQSDHYAKKGTKEYVAFNPNQIKSATGNTGQFNANNADIRYSKKQIQAQAKEVVKSISKEGSLMGFAYYFSFVFLGGTQPLVYCKNASK